MSTIEQAWIYRGGLVGVSIVSAVLIASVAGGRFPARLLEAAPLVAIGKVSYGIYLFHWPVFMLLTPERTGLGRLPLFTLQCAVTAVLTVVSYRLIEQPVRRGRVVGRDRVMVPTMLASAGVVAAAAVLVVPTPGLTPTEELLALGEQDVVEFMSEPARWSTSSTKLCRLRAAGAGGPDVEPVPPPRVAVLGSAPVPAAALSERRRHRVRRRRGRAPRLFAVEYRHPRVHPGGGPLAEPSIGRRDRCARAGHGQRRGRRCARQEGTRRHRCRTGRARGAGGSDDRRTPGDDRRCDRCRHPGRLVHAGGIRHRVLPPLREGRRGTSGGASGRRWRSRVGRRSFGTWWATRTAPRARTSTTDCVCW